MTVPEPASDPRSASERLNRECFCLTLDQGALLGALSREVGSDTFGAELIATRPHLFSPTPMFISEGEIGEMLRVVAAIERVSALAPFRQAVLSWAPASAQHDFGPRGAFMGYDFHLTEEGPKLIEINSNAGGALLNAALARAQRVCCVETEADAERLDAFDPAVLRMFGEEWRLQRGSGTPRRIAIVDDDPAGQYLYPEFLLAKRLFEKHGIDAVIADAKELRYEAGRLLADGTQVDLVYNRLVDFPLDRPEHAALRAAYLEGAVVVTPNPHVHALYADKRNLALLSDPALLRRWGLPEPAIADLSAVPRTVVADAENAEQLWQERKQLFFKPFGGHGGKAVYRGDKVTKRVFEEIVAGGYVAQDFAPPGERMIKRDGETERCKADMRLYTYDGALLLTAARLYQGQVTNFRTPGGGFAPVFAV